MKPLRAQKYRTVRAVFTSPQARRRTIGWLLVLATAVFGSAVLVGRFLPWVTDPAALRAEFEAAGPFAPAAFVLVQATQVIIAPIPGHVLGFVSGYLFGAVYGTVYCLLGALIGSYVVLRLSRQYGRAHVERAINPAFVDTFDTIVQQRGLFALFVVFLVPGLPDDVICFVAGLTDLRIRDVLVVSMVGRLPGYLVVNTAGAEFEAGHVSVAAVLVGTLVVLSVVGYVWRETLLAHLSGSTNGLDGR